MQIKARLIEVRGSSPAAVRRIWEDTIGQAKNVQADKIVIEETGTTKQAAAPTTRKLKRRSI